MKQFMLLFLAAICLYSFTKAPSLTTATHAPVTKNNTLQLGMQPGASSTRMAAIVFKSQDYCRAELPDFEFDIHYSVVSATVYFSGTNFKGVEKGKITSNSLKPLRQLMDRCSAGTLVVFDEVKVKGPDNEIRAIDGLTLQLF